MILNAVQIQLEKVKTLCTDLSDEQFTSKLEVLNGSSVGAHVRHIIEFYNCLLEFDIRRMVNYDKRKRDKSLENSPDKSIRCRDKILYALDGVEDLDLKILSDYSTFGESESISLASTFYRELAFNVEHTIHHLAVIKIGIQAMDTPISLDENVGYAPSTIRNNYKKICVQ